MNDMPNAPKSTANKFDSGVIRFGNFEVDTRSGELRRGGIRVKLSGQPFDVLVALLEKPGQVVTREELHDKLWAQDTFVDFEHGLNKAINKVRDALGDDADNPRFIETLPRRGYRFLAPVTVSAPAEIAAENRVATEPVSRPSPQEQTQERRTRLWPIFAAGLVAVTLLAVAVVFSFRAPRAPQVLRYTQLTNDGRKKIGYLSTAITTDGSRIYFGEQNSQRQGTIAQISVNGGSVTTLTTWNDPAVLALDYSSARSELLASREIQSPLWALSVPGGSALRRIGDFLVDGAAWSPDGQFVVYGKVNAVYIAKADGSDSRKLVTVNGDPEAPRWSPDGKVIRFTLNAWSGPNLSMWEVLADGSNLHPLFPDWQTRSDGWGKWTPDGRYFIFCSLLANGYDATIMALREKKRWFEHSAPKPVPLTNGPLSFSGVVPSTDGKKIFAGGFLDRGELMRFDLKRHAWEPFLSGLSAADLDFSRDDEWVTYVLVPEATLWRSRVDGSERLQLTTPPMRASYPRWSPDGKQITFVGLNSTLETSIYLIAADGGPADRLTKDAGAYGDPNWSADGTRLVFGENTWFPKAVHIFDLKTRQVSDLPESNGLFSPRWSPDGSYIIAVPTGLPPWQSPDRKSPVQPQLMRFDFSSAKWTKWIEASMINDPTFSRDGKYVYFSNTEHLGMYRVKAGENKIETVASIDFPGGMKQDDYWYWTGLGPDDAPLFLRDASTEEIYALDLDLP